MNILKCAKQNPEREIKYSSLAQSVEYVTVNHGVVGSSPTGGAIVTGRFYNLWQKALFYKAFLSFWGKKLSEKNNPTPCEPSGLEPSTISHL